MHLVTKISTKLNKKNVECYSTPILKEPIIHVNLLKKFTLNFNLKFILCSRAEESREKHSYFYIYKK